MFIIGNKSIVGYIISLIVGLLMIAIPYAVLKDMIFTIIGIIVVVINIIPCIFYWYSYKFDKNALIPAIMSTISVSIGLVFIFWHDWIISLILAIWLIILPIIKIYKAQNKKAQLKKEVPYFIVALLLFFVPAEAILEIVLKVFGCVIMLWGIVNLIIYAIKNKNDDIDDNDGNSNSSNNSGRIVIDAEVNDL